MRIQLNAIAAVDAAMGIGRAGDIPWKAEAWAAADRAWFKEVTSGGSIIMGRRTWESIKRPLPDRRNIVVSKTLTHTALPVGVIAAWSLEDAIAKAGSPAWVIGGAELYAEFLAHPLARELHICYVPGDWRCDVKFPSHEWERAGATTRGDLTFAHYLPPAAMTAAEMHFNDILTRAMVEPPHDNRTGVPTRSLLAEQVRFPLTRGGRRILPLLTCKKVLARAVYIELLWFLRAEPNISFLKQNNVSIWDANTTEEFIARRGLNIFPGETGPIYGCQWRNWGGKIDQVAQAIELLRTDPNSRRIIVNAWNPTDNPAMVLPPCHYSFQFVVIGGALNIVVNMRSADMGLGVPFNIASYAFLAHMVALVVGMPAGELVINMADCHVYETHLAGLREWLTVAPVGSPFLEFSPRVMEKAAAGTLHIDDFHAEFGWSDITIRDYYPGPVIKLPMAV